MQILSESDCGGRWRPAPLSQYQIGVFLAAAKKNLTRKMSFARRLALSAALLPLAAALHAPRSLELASPPFSDGLRAPMQSKTPSLLASTRGHMAASSSGNFGARLQALRGGAGNTPLVGCIGSLVKNIVGSGVLSLAGAVAAFSDQPNAIYPALAIALVAGVMSAYCFALVGRTCRLTGTYKPRSTR